VVGAENQTVYVGRQSARPHCAVPGSDLNVVPGLSHLVHYGAPEVVADTIEAVAAAAPGRLPAADTV